MTPDLHSLLSTLAALEAKAKSSNKTMSDLHLFREACGSNFPLLRDHLLTLERLRGALKFAKEWIEEELNDEHGYQDMQEAIDNKVWNYKNLKKIVEALEGKP